MFMSIRKQSFEWGFLKTSFQHRTTVWTLQKRYFPLCMQSYSHFIYFVVPTVLILKRGRNKLIFVN